MPRNSSTGLLISEETDTLPYPPKLNSTFSSMGRSNSRSPVSSPSSEAKSIGPSPRQKKITFKESSSALSKNEDLPLLSPKSLQLSRRSRNSPTSVSSSSPLAITKSEEEVYEDEPVTLAYDPFSIHTTSNEQEIRAMNINTNLHSPFSEDSKEGGLMPGPSTMMDMKKQALKKVALPSRGYGKSGRIDYRSGFKSILLRKWSNGYWLHVFPARIAMFDSLEDMDQWKEMMDEEMSGDTDAVQQTLENDDVSISSSMPKARRERARDMKHLVKASINFDSNGDLLKKMKSLEDKNRKKLSTLNGGAGSSGIGSVSWNQSKVGDCNDDVVPRLPISYIMEEVRSKYYNVNEPLMHTFKISHLKLTGRSVTTAFGSTVPQEVKRLRAVIRKIITVSKKATKKRSKKKGMGGDDTISGIYTISRSAKSEVTALSNTVYGHKPNPYGHNTMNRNHRTRLRLQKD